MLAAVEGLVTTGTVVYGGVTAGQLIVGSGSSEGPGIETDTLSMPQVQEGWAPSNTVVRPASAQTSWPGAGSKTTWMVESEPAYGTTGHAEFQLGWATSWWGDWYQWNEGAGVGWRIVCQNGTAAANGTPTAYRGGPLGGVKDRGVVTYTSSVFCQGANGGYDHIEAINAYNSTLLATYYPPGHPDRPGPLSPGLGTVTRWVDCVDGDGVVTRLY
ncbi:MAG: hypothetical protein LBU50_03335, partial [Cellulomonas sp.]|nr:hypothetical protein [Cellulomonas sp.]